MSRNQDGPCAYFVHQGHVTFGTIVEDEIGVKRTMVVGLGTDLTEIARIRRSVERFGGRFLERIYTAAEIAYCLRKKDPSESLAARFAAKEAAAKALGTGISRGVSWQEFEVRREPGGKPLLRLSGRAAELAAELGIDRLSLSLTHTHDLAMAVVVAEGLSASFASDRPEF